MKGATITLFLGWFTVLVIEVEWDNEKRTYVEKCSGRTIREIIETWISNYVGPDVAQILP